MASETKVGLIAGLTFIICFAVILANRGGHEFTTASGPSPFEPDTRAAGDWQIPSPTGAVQRSSARAGREVGIQSSRETASRRLPQDVPSARRPRSPQGHDRQLDHAADTTQDRTDVAQAERAPHSVIGSSPEQAGSGDGHGTTLISSSQEADSRLALLERRLDELAEDLTAPRTSTTVRINGARPKPAPAQASKPVSSVPSRESGALGAAHYAVMSGDTLSSIAAAHYGRKSTRSVNAIFDANRGVLSSPDVLRPGMELVIPAIEGANPVPSVSSGVGETKARRQSSPPAREVGQPSRWYQIKKNDRYVTIAREQLGNASRWPEIHELNKDKFPDAGRIRTGVRIRLPVRRLAASTERRP